MNGMFPDASFRHDPMEGSLENSKKNPKNLPCVSARALRGVQSTTHRFDHIREWKNHISRRVAETQRFVDFEVLDAFERVPISTGMRQWIRPGTHRHQTHSAK